MSWKALPAILILGLAGSDARSAEGFREQSRRTIEIPGVSTVVVENARGRVEVRPGRDQSLHIRALKIVRSARDSEAQRLADRTVVELVRKGATYAVRVQYPRSKSVHVNVWEDFGHVRASRVEVQLTLEVPAGVGVRVEGVSAELVGEDLAGSLTMKSGSGDASLDRCSGDVQVSTVSGKIEFRRAAGNVRLETVSGDVDAALAPPLREARVATTSGDIRVALPEEMGCALEMRTTSGELDLRIPAQARTVSRGFVSALVGQGSAPVTLRTISGSVTVMRGSF